MNVEQRHLHLYSLDLTADLASCYGIKEIHRVAASVSPASLLLLTYCSSQFLRSQSQAATAQAARSCLLQIKSCCSALSSKLSARSHAPMGTSPLGVFSIAVLKHVVERGNTGNGRMEICRLPGLWRSLVGNSSSFAQLCELSVASSVAHLY
jgi:hypothetical protein